MDGATLTDPEQREQGSRTIGTPMKAAYWTDCTKIRGDYIGPASNTARSGWKNLAIAWCADVFRTTMSHLDCGQLDVRSVGMITRREGARRCIDRSRYWF